jgi:heme/copper-type cytochrome/quinol oxidase subunit 2
MHTHQLFGWRWLLGIAGLAVVALSTAPRVDAQDDTRRDVAIAARDNGFTPAKLEVRLNDLVKVTFTAEDHPHSFNIDEYRIAKRARPGQPAVFEFRADRAGRFPYYCNLSSPAGKHEMRGELVVVER